MCFCHPGGVKCPGLYAYTVDCCGSSGRVVVTVAIGESSANPGCLQVAPSCHPVLIRGRMVGCPGALGELREQMQQPPMQYHLGWDQSLSGKPRGGRVPGLSV